MKLEDFNGADQFFAENSIESFISSGTNVMYLPENEVSRNDDGEIQEITVTGEIGSPYKSTYKVAKKTTTSNKIRFGSDNLSLSAFVTALNSNLKPEDTLEGAELGNVSMVLKAIETPSEADHSMYVKTVGKDKINMVRHNIVSMSY